MSSAAERLICSGKAEVTVAGLVTDTQIMNMTEAEAEAVIDMGTCAEQQRPQCTP